MKTGDKVRLTNPENGEESLVYIVTNYNEVTERCYIQPINLKGWGKGLIPQELVSVNDIISL